MPKVVNLSKRSYLLGALTIIVSLAAGLVYIKLHNEQLAGEEAGNTKGLANDRSSKHIFVQRYQKQSKAELKAKYDDIFAAVIERNPELRTKWRPVKDESNRFLQWEMLRKRVMLEMADVDGELSFKKDLDAIFSDEKEWDYDEASVLMAKYSDLLDEMTTIGLLKESSVAGIPIEELNDFLSITRARGFIEFLLAGARFAVESNDRQLAINRLNAAANLSANYQSVEVSSALNISVDLVSHLEVIEFSMLYILPTLALEPFEISELRQNFQNKSVEDNFKTLMRGEFTIAMRAIIIPLVENGPSHGSEDEVKDTEALYDAIAQGYLAISKGIDGLSERDILELQKGELSRLASGFFENLSQNALSLTGNYFMGIDSYPEMLVRADGVYNQYAAAMAVLANETVPLELITGKPYIFDAETRTLSLPQDDLLNSLEIKPLRIP